MYCRAKKSYAFDDVVAQVELSLFTFDAIGHKRYFPPCISKTMSMEADYSGSQVVSYHDHCEDG